MIDGYGKRKYWIFGFHFIHKTKLTPQSATCPWCNSKFNFIRSLPDLILVIRPILRETESHCWNDLFSKLSKSTSYNVLSLWYNFSKVLAFLLLKCLIFLLKRLILVLSCIPWTWGSTGVPSFLSWTSIFLLKIWGNIRRLSK